MAKPEVTEYAPYYSRYIDLVGEGDIVRILEEELDAGMRVLRRFSEWDGAYRYAAGKWSIKEVIGHIIDTERVMAFRALWFARGTQAELPGFEQDDWVKNSNFDASELSILVDEWAMLRRSNVEFFRSLPAEAWSHHGVANKGQITVKALAYVIAGHEMHHRNVLALRYVKDGESRGKR